MMPSFSVLDRQAIESIISEAKASLVELGVEIQHAQIVADLVQRGAHRDSASGRLRLTEPMIDEALARVPAEVALFDVSGDQAHRLGGHGVHFTPGSSALRVLDGTGGRMRTPDTMDYIGYVKVVEQIPEMAAQSTALIPGDVPNRVSDSYRVFLSLLFGSKPIVTGVFESESFEVMRDFFLAVRGSADALRDKPLAVFSCCPTSPLSWTHTAAQCIWDCAEWGIPVELVPMPLSGFTSPVTLFGSLIQQTAENLSGIVISQTHRPGAPLLFGGSPSVFDVRFESTPMGAMESMMMACGASEVGHHLGLPTQAYIALSDAKSIDAQAGLETGMGAVLAALSGIDSVSGPGMMDFENCFSVEKLLLDAEICRMALRLTRGIGSRDDVPIRPLLEELLRDQHLLISPHTLAYLDREHAVPGPIIDRMTFSRWQEEGLGLMQRLTDARHLLEDAYQGPVLSSDVRKMLVERMEHAARQAGMANLPERNH